MRRTRLFLIMGLVALAVPLFGATSAQADVAACATAGAAGPITPGVQAIVPDLGTTGADSLLGDPLTDTDNGVRNPNTPPGLPNSGAGWEDGIYEFHDDASLCLTVDTNENLLDTGLYSAAIDSHGAYDNTICGTGLAIDRGPQDSTTVGLTPIAALGPGEPITDANYTVAFAAGTGPILINATTSGGEVLTGGGIVHITPVVGNCVTTDVTNFSVAAAFVAAGP